MWCHGTVAELLGEAGLCRCARMPDAAYVQVTDCYWRKVDYRGIHPSLPSSLGTRLNEPRVI